MSTRRLLLIGALLVASLGYLLAGRSKTAQASKLPPIQGRNKTVIFLTNADHGLSSVHVATASSLLENYPDIDVHYASFAGHGDKLALASSYARKKTPAARDIIFHELDGLTMVHALAKGGMTIDNMIHAPGAKGLDRFLDITETAISPWDVEDHLSLYKQMRSIIDDLDPAVVVLDWLLRPALDAVWDSNRLHAIVTPNALQGSFQAEQPYGSLFWKYPS